MPDLRTRMNEQPEIPDACQCMRQFLAAGMSAAEAGAAFAAVAQAMHESQEQTDEHLDDFWGAAPVHSNSERGPIALICDRCETWSPGDAAFCIGCGQRFGQAASTGETIRL
ncbi:MAG: hypothetical protein KBA95_12060 [Acidobacteria bacterium]|nr:hypothetical protein [Acidobacteriota bacterium]